MTKIDKRLLAAVSVIGCIILALSGCAKSLDQKIGEIQKGMTVEEVIQILGPPEAVDMESHLENEKDSIFYFYGITSLEKPCKEKDGYLFMGANASWDVQFGDGGVFNIEPGLMAGQGVFVKNEDFNRVESVIDSFYARDLEKACE